MRNNLPNKLNISFPIWGLYDIDGKGFYADTDKMMREHEERGFNCIRFDDGAGLMHGNNWNWCREYMPDGLHPNDKGYEILAKRLSSFLKNL